MIRTDRKSDCAINYSLESFGDPWSLLIVRDIVFYQKSEFGEFMASAERVGSNTLSRRLDSLQDQGIISKQRSIDDGRKDRYELTEKGWALVPILIELTVWGAAFDADTGASPQSVVAMQRDRDGFAASLRSRARNHPNAARVGFARVSPTVPCQQPRQGGSHAR